MWLLVVFYICGFFTYGTPSMNSSTAPVGVNLYDMLKFSGMWIVGVFLLIPVVMLLVVIFLDKQIAPKITFLAGAVLGTLVNVYILLTSADKIVETAGGEGAANAVSQLGVDISLSSGMGFWLILVVFIAVLVWTLIKDFALSKDALKENGLKGTFSNMVEQTKAGINFEKEADNSSNTVPMENENKKTRNDQKVNSMHLNMKIIHIPPGR